MIPSPDLSVRSGNGWTIVEMAGLQQTPGEHDIGKPLGIAEGAIVLVILRAAERWTPDDETMADGCVIAAARVACSWTSATVRRDHSTPTETRRRPKAAPWGASAISAPA